MDLLRYNSFLLVVFQGVQPPLQWLWNGRNLEEQIAPLPVTTTSSLFSSLIERMRIRIFRKATDGFLKPLSDDRQRTLHRSRNPWSPAFSIAMRRKDKGTVSLTRIRLDADAVLMEYQPGDPAATPGVDLQTSNIKKIPKCRPEKVRHNQPENNTGQIIRCAKLFDYKRQPGKRICPIDSTDRH